MENQIGWHGVAPNAEQAAKAKQNQETPTVRRFTMAKGHPPGLR